MYPDNFSQQSRTQLMTAILYSKSTRLQSFAITGIILQPKTIKALCPIYPALLPSAESIHRLLIIHLQET